MTDEKLQETMERAHAGDSDAMEQIDAWINACLAPMCVTLPLPDDGRTAEIVGYDRPGCCGTCAA